MITRFASLALPTFVRTTRVRQTSAHETGLMLRSRSMSGSKPIVSNRSTVTGALLTLFFSLFIVTSAQAQVTPKKKKPAAEGGAQTVEIRGQVPTPQVVTVRPRAVPDYSRGVLVPAFYDQHFWPSILAPYRVVPTLPSESAHRPPEAAPDTAAASSPPSRE
jgi:hypothetical protein